METWRLVEKLLNSIPIANKWVFVKKQDKVGEKKIVKYHCLPA
jgi:hypothetical protein